MFLPALYSATRHALYSVGMIPEKPRSGERPSWGSWPLPKDEGAREHRFGDTTLVVAADKAGEGDVLAAAVLYGRGGRTPGKKSRVLALPPPGDPAWKRVHTPSAGDYSLMPGYPSLPVCLSLRQPFILAPGARVEGWICSHAEARLVLGGAEAVSLPLARPYKTLYGSPESGVVCRHDETDFLAGDELLLASLKSDPRLIAHPVRLHNASSAPVSVAELCVYGEQLSVLADAGGLRSERLSFVFSESGVKMRLDGAVPQGSAVLAKPRVSGEERFIERSFEVWKAITKW